MRVRPLDPHPAAWSAQQEALARMGGEARLEAAIELSEAVRELRLAGIESRHRGLSRRQAVALLVLEEHGVRLPVAR